MARAVINLLLNGIRHAIEQQVNLSLHQLPDRMELHVDDDAPRRTRGRPGTYFFALCTFGHQPYPQYGGIGLGLAIVKRIAIGHEGSVIVRTAPLEGASFILSWPLPPSVNPPCQIQTA
ncbi:ATP-binding protein [Chitinivorax sp. B]|uniref:ATP-binding protein n=1 Tax=Chitinivorax sp. B TaxID=2502235 RepID=UPI0020172570|nr:ATP-binding protein [Chitinivorax sp. B]